MKKARVFLHCFKTEFFSKTSTAEVSVSEREFVDIPKIGDNVALTKTNSIVAQVTSREFMWDGSCSLHIVLKDADLALGLYNEGK